MKRPLNPKKPNEVQEISREAVNRMEGAVRRQIFLVIAVLALVFVLIFAITVAWYTNVTRTNGLQFKTETWGFSEENISIGNVDPETPFSIRPGSEGIIPLRVDNTTNYQTVKAVVNADKTTMADAELQKRVFFYIDESKTCFFPDPESEEQGEETEEATGTETISRQYLGKERVNSYTYTILGGNSLMLSENYQSDAPLKWYWVDTLEGYYFRGTVTENNVEEQEYLRPIEYELDNATFDEETSAFLAILLNNETVLKNDYLQSVVFANDGYKGSEVKEVTSAGKSYYAIEVDEAGYGIWAYLLDAEEIASANIYDNALGGSETALNATISVTVYNVETVSRTVNNAAALREALTDEEGGTVRLTQPVTLTEPLTVAGDMTLDLNQFTIDYSGEESAYSVFNVESGSSLTLFNGSIIGSGGGSGDSASTVSAAVSSAGGEVTLSGVTVRNFDSAVSVDDSTGAADSHIKLVDCDFETSGTAVLCFGNGSGSEAASRIIVENCKIRSDYIGISGNGTSSPEKQFWGTELIILNSEIEGKWAAIYQPQQKSYTCVTNSTLTGYTGVAVKGGTVELYGSSITGTGAQTPAKASGSGWTDTGDAVYVEASYGWEAKVIVRGTENNLISEHGYLLQLFGVEGKGPGSIIVEQGAYASGFVHWNNIGTFSMNYASTEEPEEP